MGANDTVSEFQGAAMNGQAAVNSPLINRMNALLKVCCTRNNIE
jgi:hypothetical protein